jgi:hypothetical protein
VSTLLAEARDSSNLLPVIYWGEEFLINAPSLALRGLPTIGRPCFRPSRGRACLISSAILAYRRSDDR